MTSAKRDYPLHYQVWRNDTVELKRILEEGIADKEQIDARGRTPLLLAVALQHTACVDILLQHGCNVLAQTRDSWSVVQEAVSTSQDELVRLVLRHHRSQASLSQRREMSCLLASMEATDDFYIEMKWELSSWVPFLSSICAGDTYQIWKSGGNLRVDSHLTNLTTGQKAQSRQSLVLKLGSDSCTLYSIDHSQMSFRRTILDLWEECNPRDLSLRVAEETCQKLSLPNTSTYLETKDVVFSSVKGMFGFGTAKHEILDGHQAKLYNVTGMTAVTRTRTEHLPELLQQRFKDILGQTQRRAVGVTGSVASETKYLWPPDVDNPDSPNPYNLTAEEYFNPKGKLDLRDVGRVRLGGETCQSFSATMAICPDYPLKLHTQLLPVVSLLASHGKLFSCLKDFIVLQLPSGFPLRVEIPVMRFIRATVQFSNLNCTTAEGVLISQRSPLVGSSPTSDFPPIDDPAGEIASLCCIDSSVFSVPDQYWEDNGSDFMCGLPTRRDEVYESFLDVDGTSDQPLMTRGRTLGSSLGISLASDPRGRVSTEVSDIPIGTPTFEEDPITAYETRLAVELSLVDMNNHESLLLHEEKELRRALQQSLEEK